MKLRPPRNDLPHFSAADASAAPKWFDATSHNGFDPDDPRLDRPVWLSLAPSQYGLIAAGPRREWRLALARGEVADKPPATWRAMCFPERDALALLCHRFERHRRDGPAVMLGLMYPEGAPMGPRRATADLTLCFLGLDFDKLEPGQGEILRDLLATSGLRSVASTSHSHLSGGKGERWRVFIPLAEPFSVADYRDVHEAGVRWEAVCLGVADRWFFGLEIDRARTDLNGIFFLPAHRPGAPHESHIYGGEPLDWRPFAAAAVVPERRERGDGIAWDGERREGGAGASKSLTRGGRALGSWARDYAERFQIADLIADLADDKMSGVPGDRIDIECPFAENHSDPVNKRGGCWAVNAQCADRSPLFLISCLHDSCRGLTMLDHLAKMIADDWFGVGDDFMAVAELLHDDSYNPEIL